MMKTYPLSRRCLGLAVALLAAGCTTVAHRPVSPQRPEPQFSALDLRRYGEIEGERFRVPAVSLEDLKPQNLRQLVDYPTSYEPGTLVIDPKNRYLYLIQ